VWAGVLPLGLMAGIPETDRDAGEPPEYIKGHSLR
jgi:hypothetical protein